MAVELKVRFQVQVPQHGSDGKEVSELGPDAGDTRLETTDPVTGPAVAGDLVIYIANGTDEYLFGQKLRRRHVQMKVDAVLVIGRRFDEIVGEARDCRIRDQSAG